MFRFLIFFLTVGLGCFADPILLSTSGVEATDPIVESDSSGNVTAIWLESGAIKAKYKVFGGSWDSMETVTSSGAGDLGLVVNSAGNATVIWLESGIVKACSRSGGSWGSVTSLSSSGSTDPSLSIDINDNLIAIWVRGTDVESATKLAAGSWPGTPDVLGGTQPQKPKVGIGAEGTVVALWTDISNSVECICSADKSSVSGSWSTPLIITDGMHHYVNPDVDVDHNGDAVAIWYCYDNISTAYVEVFLLRAEKKKGEFFSPPTKIDTMPGTRDPMDLKTKIRFDENGHAAAAWVMPFENAYSVCVLTKPRDLPWAEVVEIGYGLYNNNFDIDMYKNSDGNTIVVFPNFKMGEIQIWEAVADIDCYNMTWNLYKGVDLSMKNSYPSIAATQVNTKLNHEIVWQHYNGMNNAICADERAEDVTQPPVNPTAVQSSTDWGVFTEYYNTVSWEASLSSDVQQYIIYRNGVVAAAVGKDTFQFIDHNQAQNGSVTYAIAAVSKSFFQSTKATVSVPPTSWW